MKTIALCLFVLISTASAWAGSALEGTVKDSRGNPIKGAEIRIQPRNANVSKATRSDASGHYFCDNLAIGTDYRVTLTINGMVKASLLNVRAGAEGRLNLASTCSRQTVPPINIWSGYRTNPPEPISARAIGRKWMNTVAS